MRKISPGKTALIFYSAAIFQTTNKFCPGDRNVYFWLGFTNKIKRIRHYVSVIYVIAYEADHHVQNPENTPDRIHRLFISKVGKLYLYALAQKSPALYFALGMEYQLYSSR